MAKLYIFLFIIIVYNPFVAADDMYGFRVYLSDKGEMEGRLEEGDIYLSQRALERRERQGINLDLTDLPIPQAYLDSLAAQEATIITKSKWLSTVVVAGSDSLVYNRLMQLSMVDSVKWVWKGRKEDYSPQISSFGRDTSRLCLVEEKRDSFYGYGQKQIKMLNGKKLHDKGFTGKGMQIAVIDAGFTNVDRIDAFDTLRLAGTYNFVSPGESVFKGDDHGTKVLSCMAANVPGVLVGTAPDATYWLLKSEDNRSEYPIEEDFWAAAVEFADSVGVDIISSSLGYFTFDMDEMSYSSNLLDGKTAFISRAANIAAEKGLLIICSAGNEGRSPWEKITFPSDAAHILTVGAITEEKDKSTFSSTGFTSDCRVKPDVVALGSSCAVIDGKGGLSYASGTSFATPIIAGLTACLWEALPDRSNVEIIRLIQETASQSKRPDAEKGFGIPDMYKAYKKSKRDVR